MQLTKQRLKEIIKDELSMITERTANVPQVQKMAAAVGVRLSYGDAKTLAARTPLDKNALVALQKALKDGSWKQMTEELASVSEDPTARARELYDILIGLEKDVLQHAYIAPEGPQRDEQFTKLLRSYQYVLSSLERSFR